MAEGSDEDNSCRICLDAVRESDHASIDSCKHNFHKSCIVSWSKITNSCPLCKKRFKKIHCGREHIAVQHKVQVYQCSQFPVGTWDGGCNACGSADREDVLLLCDGPGCELMYHIDCLVPALPVVPAGEWYCPECVRREELLNGIGEEESFLTDADEEGPAHSSENEREYVPNSLEMNRDDDDDFEDLLQSEDEDQEFVESESPVRTWIQPRSQKVPKKEKRARPGFIPWNCSVCTLLNENNQNVCEICEEPKPVQVNRRESVLDELDEFEFIREPPPPPPPRKKKRRVVEKPPTPDAYGQPKLKKSPAKRKRFGPLRQKRDPTRSRKKKTKTYYSCSSSDEEDNTSIMPKPSRKFSRKYFGKSKVGRTPVPPEPKNVISLSDDDPIEDFTPTPKQKAFKPPRPFLQRSRRQLPKDTPSPTSSIINQKKPHKPKIKNKSKPKPVFGSRKKKKTKPKPIFGKKKRKKKRLVMSPEQGDIQTEPTDMPIQKLSLEDNLFDDSFSLGGSVSKLTSTKKTTHRREDSGRKKVSGPVEATFPSWLDE